MGYNVERELWLQLFMRCIFVYKIFKNMREIKFKLGGNITIFRKEAELVHTRTHMCYPEMDNIENVHSKNILRFYS